jgi:hypothetical protein
VKKFTLSLPILQPDERLRAAFDTPQMRALREWADLPDQVALRKQLSGLAEYMKYLLPSEQDAKPKKKRSKKKKEPGHYIKLSPSEAALLTDAYRKALDKDPSLAKQAAAIAHLRDLLPKQRRGVSDATLRRLILRATKAP